MRFRLPLFGNTLLVALLVLGGSAAAVWPAAVADATRANDPVIAEVVRLLDAHLGEPLIERWLEESGKGPAHVSADDLVALKGAGASDQLIASLLDLARTTASQAPAPPGAAPAPATPPPVARPIAAPPALAMPPTAPTPAAPAIAAPAAAPGGASSADTATVVVSATLNYVHVADEGEAWNLVVYLDGVPFTPLVASPSERAATPQTSERRVAPGRHVLRWAQERHRKPPEEQGLHAALFDPQPLVFELAPGSPAALEFEFRDRAGMFRRFGPPVTVRVTQDGREIAALRPGKETYHWELLCEDYEADLGGKKPGFDDRRTLRNCLYWAELWPGLATVPSRDEVRPPVL